MLKTSDLISFQNCRFSSVINDLAGQEVELDVGMGDVVTCSNKAAWFQVCCGRGSSLKKRLFVYKIKSLKSGDIKKIKPENPITILIFKSWDFDL